MFDVLKFTTVGGRLGVRQSAAWLVAAAMVASSHDVRSQTTVLPEVQVSTAEIVDFEFDWARDGVYCPTCNFGSGNSRIVFTDKDMNLWVGGVDFNTGDFVPNDGHGVLVDKRAAFSTDWGNGPEWMFSIYGSQVVYTRYQDRKRPGALTAGVAIATETQTGWIGGMLSDGIARQSPAATLDVNDSDPRINYQDFRKAKVYWRDANPIGPETLLPIVEQTGGGSRRWVEGTKKIIFTGSTPPNPNGNSYPQVFLYDTDSTELEQLTFEPAVKWGGFMWRAPEFNNEYVFFTLVGRGRSAIAVYRKIADEQGVPKWTNINTIQMPTSMPHIWSPEPFVHNGRSWLFFTLSSSTDANDMTVPTQIAMTGIDPAVQSFRMLTNDNVNRRVRQDPEYFITAKGPYIYYNRYTAADGAVVNDGVWRVDTRLGPKRLVAP